MEQLAGSLMTHELHLSSNTESSNNKSLALKAQNLEESEADGEEMAMLVIRKFKRMINYKKFDRNKKYASSRNTTCFKCGSKDHFIKDCPLSDGEKGKTKDAYYGGTVTFGDNMIGDIVAIGKVGRIIHNDTGNIILEGTRKGDTYVVDLNEVPNSSLTCLTVIEDDPLLWHKRFGHASITLLDKLRSKELVEGLPCIKFLYDKVCDACVRGKQTRVSF
ncbi:uncharacterized protein LOC110737464 [Chenopodium quinoa]|uniref:uncharacterized protein LOC110737464 n=1 Tax=Chenopodium quinoa TaxID=63459 RepID=UPI000B79032F|nr:uncharacterized protein LOC110737464 [Chenopodium quinoa]